MEKKSKYAAGNRRRAAGGYLAKRENRNGNAEK